ncbi:hypothetical protein V1226_07020 [Lachnospiraceae bacterium JLR.KK009]|jgi:hypothetical protein
MKVGAAIAMGAFSMGLGGSFTSGFSRTLDAASGNSIQDGFASFTLQEGDVFKLSCKPTRKGAVKVRKAK